MNNSRPIVNISLLLGTIIAVSAFFLVFNNIPVQALHKEQQLLESFDDLADFAKAVRNGDEELEEIPIQSMKAADIYDDADDNLKDCIDQAAEIGDSLTDREVVHCVDDVNYFNNKYSNSTVPTTATSTATTDLADTGTDTTSTSDTADTTSTSDTADTTSTSDTADTTSTSDNSNENNLVDELVKTGKFTEAEAREFVNNNMQSGTGTDTTSDTTSTSNGDTNTADTNTADTNTADTNTADTNTADTNTADTKTSNADTNTDNSASDDTSSSNNEDNNDQSSNNNSNNPEDYDDLDELVNDIKNSDVDTEEISLSGFQDSGAYKGADQETQDCIDLAGKIGHNLGDQEIVNCSEDPNFYRNEISNTNDNNADDSSNNADDSSNNADENSDTSNDNNN